MWSVAFLVSMTHTSALLHTSGEKKYFLIIVEMCARNLHKGTKYGHNHIFAALLLIGDIFILQGKSVCALIGLPISAL